MIKLDYVVKVYTGIADDLPLIGNISGVATWSTANQSLGILSENFFRDVQSRVDISVGGNYSQYTDLKINIVRSSLVETTLKNYGTTLVGKRIELTETDGVKTRMLYRGVIRQLSAEGNETELTCSHLANSYAVDLTRSIGDEKLPLVYGQEVKNVKLIKQETPDRPETVIGDDLFPVFVVLDGTIGGTNFTQTKESIFLRCVYDDTIIGSTELLTFVNANPYMKLTGENSLVGTPWNQVYSSILVDGLTYAGMRVDLIPMNMKDGTGAYFFPAGDQVTVEGTEYEKIYFPEGITYTVDNLTYKDGERYFPFPAYVDSRIDYADRIEILDADNVGYSKVFLPLSALAVFYQDVVADGKNRVKISNGTNNITVTYLATTYTIEIGYNELFKVLVVNVVRSGPALSTYFVDDYFFLHIENSTKFKPYDIPSNLYDTKFVSYDAGTGINVTVKNIAKTLANSYVISETNHYGSGDILYRCGLPDTVANNEANKEFRLGLIGADVPLEGGNGLANDLFTGVANDWEKASLVIAVTSIRMRLDEVAGTGDVDVRFGNVLARSCEYDTGELYLSTATGNKDIAGNVVTNTSTAYKTTINKQNYETAGVAIPSGGWGLDFPIGSLAGVIDPAIAPTAIPFSWQADDTNTKDVKLELLRYTAGIGFIDILGREAWRSAIPSGAGFMFTPHEIKGKPRVEVIDSRKVYPEIGVSYGNGKINVTNTEKDTYDSSYVSGVSDSDTARDLWYAGRLIYKRYRTKNEFPKKYADISGIINESDAIDYIKNQYRLNGIEFNGTVILAEKYECTFVTSEEYIFTNDLQLGDKITFVYPNIAENGHNGIITGIAHGFDGKSTIVAMMNGDVLEQVEYYDIIESGSQADTIIESGSQTTNYVEV